MLGELTDEIESTGVRAGWIKLSAGDDGITDSRPVFSAPRRPPAAKPTR